MSEHTMDEGLASRIGRTASSPRGVIQYDAPLTQLSTATADRPNSPP